MNFLIHLFLSGTNPDIIVGNFMGDFVKGRVGTDYPLDLRAGIILHRRIDRFAESDLVFRRSRYRLSSRYGLYRGVLVDLFYDHFLARQWDKWSDKPLEGYLLWVRTQVEGRAFMLPERLRPIVPLIFGELIPSYTEVSGIARALERMSRRVARVNPLAQGHQELARNYDELLEDFQEFLPRVIDFATDEKTRLINGS
ncbi:ACP phosphodiesterase [Geobacter sp. DSM 9736]|uniref:acyl carrier protein phosphodiesterase n=1 Tax=Geobacter sp. DSM 9736 TaxID=1277350 RepID=UPI000B508DEF|nr:ACP phosphodiesterase [Geobacter sp. DSM 9736]SNB45808.1 Acyl carrier protein phosphodiesterase [Geobacter sp. DSM 9736]